MISLWLFDCLASCFSWNSFRFQFVPKEMKLRFPWCCCCPDLHLGCSPSHPERSSENAQLTKAFSGPTHTLGYTPFITDFPLLGEGSSISPKWSHMSFLAKCFLPVCQPHLAPPHLPLIHFDHALASFPCFGPKCSLVPDCSSFSSCPPWWSNSKGKSPCHPQQKHSSLCIPSYTLCILSGKRHLNAKPIKSVN